jgi:hypothetical protein
MSRIKEPALKTFKTFHDREKVGIVIPVYATIGNENLGLVQYSIEQCCDLPYQLSMGIGQRCVAANRIKGEARLDHSIRYVIHMDDDVVLPPFFASNLLSVLLQQPRDIGAVSVTMMGMRGEAQNNLHPDKVPVGTQIDALIPGTCFIYDREKTPIVWDTNYQGSQWEDTDAMMQIWARGLRTVATGNVTIMHRNNWTESKHWNENKALFDKKWPGAFND